MGKKFILIFLILGIGFFVFKQMVKSPSEVNPSVSYQTVETPVDSLADTVKVPVDEVFKKEENASNDIKVNESKSDDLNPVYDPPDHSQILVR